MVLLDYNSSADVVVSDDVLLFRSYISTVLDYAYGVFKRDSHEEFNGMTSLARRSLVTIAMQRRAVDPSITPFRVPTDRVIALRLR